MRPDLDLLGRSRSGDRLGPGGWTFDDRPIAFEDEAVDPYLTVDQSGLTAPGRPIMHAETNSEGAGAIDWLLGQWAEVGRLRADGVPIRGFTWYGFIDHVDWDSTLREDNGRQNRCGLVGLDRRPHPVQAVFRQLLAEADDFPGRPGSNRSRR